MNRALMKRKFGNISGIQLRSTHMCTKKKTNKSSGCQLTVLPRSWPVLWVFSKMSPKLKSKRLRSSSTLQDALRVYTCKSRVVWNICLQRELLHHGRRVGKEEKIEIRVVSGETNLILHSLHKANVFTLLKYL